MPFEIFGLHDELKSVFNNNKLSELDIDNRYHQVLNLIIILNSIIMNYELRHMIIIIDPLITNLIQKSENRMPLNWNQERIETNIEHQIALMDFQNLNINRIL